MTTDKGQTGNNIHVIKPKRRGRNKRGGLDRASTDAVIGPPPSGKSRTYIAHWYAVASRYRLIPSSRVYLEMYMSSWEDHRSIERFLRKQKIQDRLASRAFKGKLSLRTHMATALNNLVADIRKNA